jgi:hypothetical protein
MSYIGMFSPTSTPCLTPHSFAKLAPDFLVFAVQRVE